MSENVLRQVFEVIQKRAANPQEGSYVCYLLDKGIDKTCKKVGEEAAEVIIGAKNSAAELTVEMADLWFHCLVLLQQSGLNPEDVLDELNKRRQVAK